MNISRIMAASRIDSPFRLTLAYVLFGTIWVAANNSLLIWWQPEDRTIWMADAAKDQAFVVITASLLYGLTKRLVERCEKTAESLRESQLRWQFALEGAGDGLWDWNAETNRVFFSKQWKAMLGYAEDEIGDTRAEWETRVHPDDLPQVHAEIASHLKGKSLDYASEYRLRTKDGAYRWILGRGRIVSRSPDGRPLRVIGTHLDITDRKSGERRVRDALGFMQAVLHSAPYGIIVYKADGRTVIANESAARLVGTDVAGLLGQNFRELESWRQHGLLAAAEQALAAARPMTHNGPLVTSFDRSIWVETRFVPFLYEEEKHLLLIMVDETDKRRTFDRLHLMHAAVVVAPVGWVVTDASGTIEWVNPGFTKLTGYTAEEAVGRNPRVLKSGRHTPGFYANMWATIKRGEVWSGEMFNQRKDGGLYHEFMTIAPISGENGEIRHFVAIKQDITERKDLEKQLARAQRLESIGMLASGIAHDLNNIFAPILLSLELLKLKYPTADARKTLEMIESAGQRGAGIVRQVLTFARGIEGERRPVQPKYLVKEAAQILGETLPRNIRIETELAAGLPPVMGDATQLHQVLLNLAINARDAMPAGGCLVLGGQALLVDEARAARNPPLKPGPCLALTVADNGSGIPPQVLEHIFEPFYTTKPLGKGTGLGLSTVYGIVRSHGGAVEVATQLGTGTVFTVLLPALESPAERVDSRPPQAVPFSGAGRRVLVVDDEETIRLITLHALQRHGFTVEVAEDGQEALETFRADPARFALVLTDLMMPRMNGRQLAQQIRRLAPSLPIIASSGLAVDGSGSAEGEMSLSALGVRILLRKPYTEAELLTAMRQELEPWVAGQKNG
ncbi:PAS domain S-box protein [Opitutus sp. GAS368]|uniref:PAS domain-containing hybrid sensor histidine kinase/response regulator n=1 Tax=Opitutus sp. GAS368 TaxID=1882749 RepID=UPI00087C21E7|nr:PAS domain S-box protein [Opitutus sp. GAS368]SDR82496.1 PAS domain S-box-containing protein [Opitutus sp. GAS368]